MRTCESAGAGLTPEGFAAKLNEWARLDFKPELTQPTGRFHTGAIIALADETATAAARWETNPTGELRPELFPLALHMSANLIKNVNQGTLVAEAEMAPAPPAVTAPTERPDR